MNTTLASSNVRPSAFILTLFAVLCAVPVLAEVRLPAIFGDSMVLQRDLPVPVWGWAEPGEEVTVSLGDQPVKTKAGPDGKWMVRLNPMKAGGPHRLTVKGRNTLEFKDVLVGEVWLASGQSNMAMPVSGAKDFEQEKAAANYPQLRMFKETSEPATNMQYQGSGKWAVCNPENVGGYSATAYFFARELHKVLGIPVGVINSSVGGTGIEAWTSLEAQQAHKDRELKPIFDRWANATATWDPDKARANYEKQVEKHKASAAKAKATKTKAPRAPTKPVYPPLDRNFPANLFNGKISPLIPYAIRGGIWYQGEHNSGLGQIYDLQLQLLIGDWRKRWGQGDFPFAWVQLPNYQKAQEQPVETQGWANIREAMLRALKIPNTGVAITIDVGEAGDIHPKNKQEVGRRLSLWALAKVYGQAKSYCGPIYRASKVEGGKMVIEFDHADGGLQARNGDLKTFAIAGADKKWVAAQARIEGNTVVVSSPEVKSPAAVRYGWASNPPCNLYNGAGLPASPFRTDNWE